MYEWYCWKWFLGFSKVGWLHLRGKVDNAKYLCQIFSGFYTPKLLKSVNIWQSYLKKIKRWAFLEHSVQCGTRFALHRSVSPTPLTSTTHVYNTSLYPAITYADNVALPAFTRCTSAVQKSIDISCRCMQTCSSRLVGVGPCWDRQTDRRTDGRTPFRYTDPAGSASNVEGIRKSRYDSAWCAPLDIK